MRTLLLSVFAVCLMFAGVVALNADSAPEPPRPRPAPRPEPPPAPKPDDRPRAQSVSLFKDDFAGLEAERTKEGNFALTLSFTVPAANYEASLDDIKKDDASRNIGVFVSIKTTGEVGAQVLTKRTVKPEFSNLKAGKYVVQLWTKVRDEKYEPRAAWVIDAKE